MYATCLSYWHNQSVFNSYILRWDHHKPILSSRQKTCRFDSSVHAKVMTIEWFWSCGISNIQSVMNNSVPWVLSFHWCVTVMGDTCFIFNQLDSHDLIVIMVIDDMCLLLINYIWYFTSPTCMYKVITWQSVSIHLWEIVTPEHLLQIVSDELLVRSTGIEYALRQSL